MAGEKNKKYNVVDLFAGVGGISSGFKKAGFNILSANEYKQDIASTYKKNHFTLFTYQYINVLYYMN